MTDKPERFTVRVSETIHREIVIPARSAREAEDSALLLKETAGWASFLTMSVDPQVNWSAEKSPEAEIYRPMNLMANLYRLYDDMTRSGINRQSLRSLRESVEMQVSELSASGHGQMLPDSRQRYDTQRAQNALPDQIVDARDVTTVPANGRPQFVLPSQKPTTSFYERLKHLGHREQAASLPREQDNSERHEIDLPDSH